MSDFIPLNEDSLAGDWMKKLNDKRNQIDLEKTAEDTVVKIKSPGDLPISTISKLELDDSGNWTKVEQSSQTSIVELQQKAIDEIEAVINQNEDNKDLYSKYLNLEKGRALVRRIGKNPIAAMEEGSPGDIDNLSPRNVSHYIDSYEQYIKRDALKEEFQNYKQAIYADDGPHLQGESTWFKDAVQYFKGDMPVTLSGALGMNYNDYSDKTALVQVASRNLIDKNNLLNMETQQLQDDLSYIMNLDSDEQKLFDQFSKLKGFRESLARIKSAKQ